MQTRSEAAKKKAAAEKKDSVPPPAAESSRSIDEVVAKETNPFKFESANARDPKRIRPDFEKITETVFITDLHAKWKKLRAALTIGEKRSDHGTLQIALDEAEKNAHDAHRLYVTAKIAFDEWEKENALTSGAMWSAATRELQQEKDSGLRAKQVTDADVRSKCATLFPDEWKAQEIARAKNKATVDSLADLAEQWKSRCRTLQAMMGKLRV